MTPTEARADFPADPTSAALARRFVDTTLRAWSCDTLVDVATLLASELVSNAVLHAGTGIAVVIRHSDDGLRVEVHDGSARPPVPKHYSSLSGTGRGLLLVDRMADRWGSVPDGQGKVVWFELGSSVKPAVDDVGAFDIDELDFDDFDELRTETRPGPVGGGGDVIGGVGPRALVLVGRR